MTFLIISIVVAAIAMVVLGFCAETMYSPLAAIGAFLSGLWLLVASVSLPVLSHNAKVNKVLIQSHLENPSHYTYVQLVEHNELVLRAKVYQGTIFSFYNDVDLQTIDIDNVSQKVIIVK